MSPAPAAPWRRLAPLALGVLALHLVLLQPPPPELRPAARPAVRLFAVRRVAPEPPPATAIASARAPLPEVAPAIPAPPRGPAPPAPRPRAAPPPRPPAPTAPQPIPTAPRPAPPALAAALAPAPAPTPASGPASAPAAPAPALPPLAIPAPARHRYVLHAQVRGVTVEGHAELDWRHDGRTYEARLSLQAPPLPARMQRSTGRLTGEGLAPDYFSDRARNEQATHFDREQGRVVFSANRPQAALVAGLQDRLSVLLQLAALVAGDPARYPAGARIVLPTASTREAGDWVFEVEGEEELQLPGGTVRALRLRRPPRHPYDQRMDLWLAAGGDYAPVRLRLTNANGDVADQRWAATDRG